MEREQSLLRFVFGGGVLKMSMPFKHSFVSLASIIGNVQLKSMPQADFFIVFNMFLQTLHWALLWNGMKSYCVVFRTWRNTSLYWLHCIGFPDRLVDCSPTWTLLQFCVICARAHHPPTFPTAIIEPLSPSEPKFRASFPSRDESVTWVILSWIWSVIRLDKVVFFMLADHDTRRPVFLKNMRILPHSGSLPSINVTFSVSGLI